MSLFSAYEQKRDLLKLLKKAKKISKSSISNKELRELSGEIVDRFRRKANDFRWKKWFRADKEKLIKYVNEDAYKCYKEMVKILFGEEGIKELETTVADKGKGHMPELFRDIGSSKVEGPPHVDLKKYRHGTTNAFKDPEDWLDTVISSLVSYYCNKLIFREKRKTLRDLYTLFISG